MGGTRWTDLSRVLRPTAERRQDECQHAKKYTFCEYISWETNTGRTYGQFATGRGGVGGETSTRHILIIFQHNSIPRAAPQTRDPPLF